MNSNLGNFLVWGMIAVGAIGLAVAVPAQPTANEILDRQFFEPELVQRLQDRLGLSEVQQQNLRVELQTALERQAYLQDQIRKETERLEPLLTRAPVDEDAVLAVSDKILEWERERKRTQLRLLIRIKNNLTADQRARLQAFKDQQLALQRKLAAAQELVVQQQREGRDLSGLASFRTEFDGLVKAGELTKAEGVLDRMLRFLRQPKATP